MDRKSIYSLIRRRIGGMSILLFSKNKKFTYHFHSSSGFLQEGNKEDSSKD